MLRIWGRTNSVNVQKVLWCCAELEIAFERIDAGMQHGVVTTSDYLALNPNALVPTIDDDGFVLWESNVIVRYLCSRYGHGLLFPDDSKVRFQAEKWMDWQATTLWPAFRPVFLGLVRTPSEQRDQTAITGGWKETLRVLGALDGQLARTRFVAGDGFTMGDIPVGASIYRCFALGMERAKLQNVARWYDELTRRPGYRAHIMLPLS